MFERFTPDARAVVINAQKHARRLGHRYIGCEHLLLAAVFVDQPASAVLHERGITPERVEEVIVRQIGLGGGTDLFHGLNQQALASIGIDLDAVRARIEASFGPGALARASQAARGRRRSPAPARRWLVWAGALRGLRRRRRGHGVAAAHGGADPGSAASSAQQGAEAGSTAAAQREAGLGSTAAAQLGADPSRATAESAEATGRYQATVPSEAHLPFTPRAKKILHDSLREAQARRDNEISALHLVLALVTMKSGMAPAILSELGAAGPSLRAAVVDRYRQAS
jgi:ATP-dependent Clp protease ATP-binding subunit ClpA